MKVGLAPFRGETMAEIINPTNGYRGALAKKGIKPKDHITSNKKEIAETEKALTKFKNQPGSSEKLSKMKQFTQVLAKTSNRPQTARTINQPPDFIKQNIREALTMRPKEYILEVPQDFRDTYTDYGKVPEFLHGIKADIQAQKIRKAYENDKKKWPQGYRMLPENEKEQRIVSLNEERNQLVRDLGSFKFSSDSNLRKDQRSAKEKRLNEIEFELNRLSLVKVFVRK